MIYDTTEFEDRIEVDMMWNDFLRFDFDSTGEFMYAMVSLHPVQELIIESPSLQTSGVKL